MSIVSERSTVNVVDGLDIEFFMRVYTLYKIFAHLILRALGG